MTEKQIRYINSRIHQLTEDMSKANDEYDKSWYKRLIQELDWIIQMKDKPTKNCNLDKYIFYS